jgi:hypothetical protein
MIARILRASVRLKPQDLRRLQFGHRLRSLKWDSNRNSSHSHSHSSSSSSSHSSYSSHSSHNKQRHLCCRSCRIRLNPCPHRP